MFVWAVVVGLLAVPLGIGIRWIGRVLQTRIERRLLMLTPLAGLAIPIATPSTRSTPTRCDNTTPPTAPSLGQPGQRPWAGVRRNTNGCPA